MSVTFEGDFDSPSSLDLDSENGRDGRGKKLRRVSDFVAGRDCVECPSDNFRERFASMADLRPISAKHRVILK